MIINKFICDGIMKTMIISKKGFKIYGKKLFNNFFEKNEIDKMVDIFELDNLIKFENTVKKFFFQKGNNIKILWINNFLEFFSEYTEIKKAKNFINELMKNLNKYAYKRNQFVFSFIISKLFF